MRAVDIRGSCVLDASAALSWLFEDELDDIAHAMAIDVAKKGAIVPALFRWEMQNILLASVRRSRITQEVMDARLDDLGALNLVTDVHILNTSFDVGISLARRFGLSAYDAAYLELAVRLGRPLMTRDAKLAKAADEMSVAWRMR